MSSEKIEEEIQRKGLNAPRVLLAELEANVVDVEIVKHVSRSGQVLRWAIITTRSGFAVTGKPACAVSPENDDAELGTAVAINNAKIELWPLMGYALRERLHREHEALEAHVRMEREADEADEADASDGSEDAEQPAGGGVQ